jgi:hypothetical protein
MKYLIIGVLSLVLVGCGGSGSSKDPFEEASKSLRNHTGKDVTSPTDPFKDFISKR